MPIRNTTTRWGSVAQLLHWVIVILIITQFVLGYKAHWATGLAKLAPVVPHKSIGITILGLAVLRLVWRLMNPTPVLPAGLKPWERAAAHVTHYGLYVLLFAMPLIGWIASSARSFPVSWFGLAQLPDLVGSNRPLYDTLMGFHYWLSWVLVAIVALHVAAALKHHLFLRDDVLRRMLPFTRT
ncbi:MAG: cytochrome b [Gammaproteobacteria bacterium]